MELLPANADGECAGVAGQPHVSGADVPSLFPGSTRSTFTRWLTVRTGLGGLEWGWNDSFPAIVQLIEEPHCFIWMSIDLNEAFLLEVFTTRTTPVSWDLNAAVNGLWIFNLANVTTPPPQATYEGTPCLWRPMNGN
jgi:hypothetical protein